MTVYRLLLPFFYCTLQSSRYAQSHYRRSFPNCSRKVTFLFSCTSKSACAALPAKFGNKFRDHNRGDHKLVHAGAFGKLLCLIAYITDDRMNLPTVAGIHRRQFTDQSFYRHAGAWKHMP